MASEGRLDANSRGRFREQSVGHELEKRQAGGRVAHRDRPLRSQLVRPHVGDEVEGEGCASSGGDDLRAGVSMPY